MLGRILAAGLETEMTDLWEGARRLPYFFTVHTQEPDDSESEWIMCPQCAMEQRDTGRLTAQYTTLRTLMCCRCGILMGPINRAETR